MRWLFRWLRRLLIVLVLLILGLLSPVAYTELACRGDLATGEYEPILTDPAHHRSEARTLLTYPEWHIVHAYDDYGEVIRTGDPHDFAYFRAISGYWSSLCALTQAASAHGGVSGETKQLVYTIGVSFTAELLAKALYEETIGRVFAMIDGDRRAPLEVLSAKQAAEYAKFLQQVPWYRWDFVADAEALKAAKTDILRDRERNFALGIEYGVKAAYAEVIAAAVANVGPDELEIRSVVKGLSASQLAALEDVTVIETRPEGVEIETPRYRAFTHNLAALAASGAEIVEIAGNDDILLTVTGGAATALEPLHSFPRQGYGDTRYLLLVKVRDLANTLKKLEEMGVTLEHIHDY